MRLIEACCNIPQPLQASIKFKVEEPIMQKEIIKPSMPLLIQDLGMQYPNENSRFKKRYGIFKCSCGKEFKSVIQDVKRETTRSCGCYKKTSQWTRSHGLHGHKLYNIWNLMMQRVSNPKHPAYQQYGLVGITVCKEWESVENFIKWAESNGWVEGLTIDRKNGEQGYTPDNCRWTTKSVQSQNTKRIRKNNKTGYRGVSWVVSKNKFVATIGVNGIGKTLGAFLTAKEAAIAYDAYVIKNNLEHTRNFDTIT